MLGRQFDDTYVFVFRNLSLSRSHQEDSNEKGYAWILPSTKIWMNWVEKWGDLMVKTGNVSFTSPTLQVRLFPIYIHCWNKSYSYFFRPEVTACGLRCLTLHHIQATPDALANVIRKSDESRMKTCIQLYFLFWYLKARTTNGTAIKKRVPNIGFMWVPGILMISSWCCDIYFFGATPQMPPPPKK